jgi:hypothetical protein
MRFHESVVDKLIYLCGNYGGHTNEKKLQEHIERINLSTHIMPDGSLKLVDTGALINERNARRINIGDIIPMTFHPSVVKKLLYMNEMSGGHSNQGKLKSAFANFDLTPYERNTGTGGVVLVASSDYMNVLNSIGRKGE